MVLLCKRDIAIDLSISLKRLGGLASQAINSHIDGQWSVSDAIYVDHTQRIHREVEDVPLGDSCNHGCQVSLVVELEAVGSGGAIQVDGQSRDTEDRSRERAVRA